MQSLRLVKIFEKWLNPMLPRQGMGATCVAALIIGKRLFAVTVGDSRLYLMREGGIRKLSTDHTWIQEAIEAGIMQPEEANGHPNAHVIRRYLGSPKPPEVDHRLRLADDETDMQAEDNQGMMPECPATAFCCAVTDSLTWCSDDEILEIFEQNLTGVEAGQMLVDLANARGGHDNITLISVQMPQKVTAGGVPLLRYLTVGCLSVIALGILFVAMVYGWGLVISGGIG
jgi:PPM family protein phosphatase